MPTADEFRETLYRIFYEAFKQGQTAIEVNAGDLHARVGGYPGTNHRMPSCCSVMRAAMDPSAGDRVLSEPRRGQGATLTIRYTLPRAVKPAG